MASRSSCGFTFAGLLVLALGMGVGLERLRSSELRANFFHWPWTVGSEPATPDAELAGLLEGSGRKAMGHESAASMSGALTLADRSALEFKVIQPISDPSLRIRVGLVSQGMNAAVGGTGRWCCSGRDGAREEMGSGSSLAAAELVTAGGAIQCQSRAGDSLTVNGTAYSGTLALHRQSDGVRVVNELSLEDYVASVVGAETPASWSREALKAQAVAARSYALAHMARPASRVFHLGDTRRWQAYRGRGSVHPRTLEATEGTEGMILSHGGGIVESLYAATDGISREVHGHLGASMSQRGANNLANRGLAFEQILGQYYPGASLARLTRRRDRVG